MSKKRDNKNRVLPKGVIQLANGCYRYRYTDNAGKRQIYDSYRLSTSDRTPKGKKDKVAIKDYMLEVAAAQKKGNDLRKGDTTLNEVVHEYFNHQCDTGKIKIGTYRNYVNAWKHAESHSISNMPIKKLRNSHFEKLFSDLFKANPGDATINLIKKKLKNVMEFACDEDYIEKNYSIRALKAVKINLKEREPLNAEQEANFLSFLNDSKKFNHLYSVVAFMLESAARISEVAALTLNDIDLERRTISINKQYKRELLNKDDYLSEMKMSLPKTPTSIRIIPLSNKAIEVLEMQIAHLKYLEHSGLAHDLVVESHVKNEVCKDFIFLNDNNKPWESTLFNKQIHDAVAVYNEIEYINAQREEREPKLIPKFTAHIMRHTACTRLAKLGIDPKVLQAFMGHKNPIATNVYNHASLERLSEEMQRIDNL